MFLFTMNFTKFLNLQIPSSRSVTQFFVPKHEAPNTKDIEKLQTFLHDKPRILVVTGEIMNLLQFVVVFKILLQALASAQNRESLTTGLKELDYINEATISPCSILTLSRANRRENDIGLEIS